MWVKTWKKETHECLMRTGFYRGEKPGEIGECFRKTYIHGWHDDWVGVGMTWFRMAFVSFLQSRFG
jgi:hypothetical protein